MSNWYECKYLEYTGFFGTTMYCTKDENHPERIDDDTYEQYCKDKCEECDIYNERTGTICFLTTACCEIMGKADDCFELNTLRNFRDTYMKENGMGFLVEEYYKIAPEIVRHVNECADAKTIWTELYYKYIVPCVSLATENTEKSNKHCLDLYKTMVMELKKQYL